MPARVAVVTDSAASMPATDTVAVVPLRVRLGDTEYAEPDLTSDQIVAALRSGRPVGTSQPPPDAFAAAYARAAEQGAEAIVSIHLSAALSGTCTAASAGAELSPIPVSVVDSACAGFGLRFAVEDAAAVAAGGGDLAAVTSAAEQSLRDTAVWFYVETLEHLRRGGRIGSAAALVGSVLAIKPILRLDSGRIVAAEKVRTAERALTRLVDLAAQHCGSAPVDLAVQHLDAAELAAQLGSRLRDRLPGLRRLEVCEITAAIGAHVGPGMLAVVLRNTPV